jgi:hypothetical protein
MQTRAAVSSADKADAMHQAQVHEQWRDWDRYLQAHLQLLDALQAEATSLPSFERQDDAWEMKRERAQADLKRIPGYRRGLFDRVREERRQDVQHELEAAQRANGSRRVGVDADIVEREALTSLQLQATGGPAGERGYVPMGDGKWYEVHVPSLRDVPDAADYSVISVDQAGNKQRAAVIVSLLALMVLGVWLTWPRSVETRSGTQRPALEVNGTPTQPWTLREADVVHTTGALVTLPISATAVLPRPRMPQDRATAFWHMAMSYPITICLPPEQTKAATALRLRSGGDLPVRVYALQATAPDQPDLVVAACSSGTTQLYGRLTGIESAADHVVGHAVMLEDGSLLRVRSVMVVGPAQDRTLAEGQQRVDVVVERPAGDEEHIDWSALAPTLLLASGESLLPSETAIVSGSIDLRYLIPALVEPVDAAWTLSSSLTSQQRWRVRLEPPPTRTALLQRALRVSNVAAERRDGGGGVRITFQVLNTGPDPLQLAADDIRLLHGATQLSIPVLPELETALAPNERRSVTLDLAGVAQAQTLEFGMGADRFRIRF